MIQNYQNHFTSFQRLYTSTKKQLVAIVLPIVNNLVKWISLFLQGAKCRQIFVRVTHVEAMEDVKPTGLCDTSAIASLASQGTNVMLTYVSSLHFTSLIP